MSNIPNWNAARGFTLLEVLVALFIASISVGALGMTLGHLHRTNQFEQHAERFTIWLERIRQHAVVRNMTYRIDYDEDKNTFALLEYRRDSWQSAVLDVSNMVNPELMNVRHTDEKRKAPLQILIYPDNSYSEFDFNFAVDSKNQILVYGDGFNTITLGNKDL